MRSLYEGILADIEDTLSSSDDNIALVSANMPDSPLRKMFCVDNSWIEQPFALNNKELTVSTENSRGGTAINSVQIIADEQNRLSDYIKNVESLKILAPCSIFCKDIDKDICKSIISPSICIRSTRAGEINNVRLRAESVGKLKIIPKISIEVPNPKISNSVLDIDSTVSSNGRLLCLGIPEFKNVSSSSIQVIDCSSTKEIVFAGTKPLDVFADKKWTNLFEFGYTLKYCTGRKYDEATASTVSIKSMKDIKKLVTSKDFYGRIYNEWPYRLKPNVKLSEFIDVSKFDKLERINIYDKKVTVVFEKLTGNWAKFNSAYKSAFGDILKTTWDQMHPEYNQTNIGKHIPVTADGWRVIIIRY